MNPPESPIAPDHDPKPAQRRFRVWAGDVGGLRSSLWHAASLRDARLWAEAWFPGAETIILQEERP